MNKKKYGWKAALLLVITLTWGLCMPALAEGVSNDNSLASLGILTEGAEVSPEFQYGTTEYDVTVPAGTEKLELDPVPSNENAWIVDITGTELVNGEATVTITVSAESGEQYPYYLYVKASGEAGGTAAPAETEAPVQTETEKQTETEPETEDPRYVKVDRTALEEAENTINALKTETSSYRDRASILMKILYGMIAFCVVLLFVVINLILKKKDLKAELNEYRGYGYPQEDTAAYPQEQQYTQQPHFAHDMEEQDAYYGQEASDRQPYSEEMDSQRYERGPVMQEELPEKRKAKPAPAAMSDDPATVPKPSKAKKKTKKMPEYEQTQREYTYRQPSESQHTDQNVEVTMIDL